MQSAAGVISSPRFQSCYHGEIPDIKKSLASRLGTNKKIRLNVVLPQFCFYL